MCGALASHDSVSYRSYHIQLLAESGDIEAAGRQLAEFEQYVTRVDFDVPSYWHAAAMVSLYTGNCDSARTQIDRVGEASAPFLIPLSAAVISGSRARSSSRCWSMRASIVRAQCSRLSCNWWLTGSSSK